MKKPCKFTQEALDILNSGGLVSYLNKADYIEFIGQQLNKSFNIHDVFYVEELEYDRNNTNYHVSGIRFSNGNFDIRKNVVRLLNNNFLNNF